MLIMLIMNVFVFVLTYIGVSLNGGTPISHPKMIILVGKPMVVGEAHHFKETFQIEPSRKKTAFLLFIVSGLFNRDPYDGKKV